jgi:adenosylcobinamide-phosphate synthase
LKRGILLPAAYLLDQIAGDPEWFPHPVRLIGLAVARGEAAVRRPGQSAANELGSGAALTIAIVAGSYCLTEAAVRLGYRHSRLLGNAIELILGWTCIAARNLEEEAVAVVESLECQDLDSARRRLSRIVGRDTHNLDSQEVSRAVIETVAESASDGIVSPLFYMALGGVPLAMAYKAINTLDSMIGHADARHFYFGKAAARLDDIANYLPARLTALSIVAASPVVEGAEAGTAARIWSLDGDRHKSPNAGQPESAMAGALRVRLGGDNTYAGEVMPAQMMGEEFSAPASGHARRAIRLISAVGILGVGFSVVLAMLVQSRKSK